MIENNECRIKDIPGFPNYKITDDGRVLSKRKGWDILAPSPCQGGYLQVHLYHKGDNKPISIHRLVALAFIPNPKNLKTVDHIDCDKTNNTVSNLKWMSLIDNIHKYKKNNLPIGVQRMREGYRAMRSIMCKVYYSKKLPTIEAADYWYKSFGVNSK